MFLGVDCFKDDNIFENIVVFSDMNRLEMGNGKFDEIYITKDLEDTKNEQNNVWIYGNTVFTSHFDNSMSAGNLSGNLNVGHIKIKRRNIDDLKLEDLKIIPYTPNINQYSYIDNFVEALEEYEYSIQPIAINGALGMSQSKQSNMVDFEGAYLVTEDEILHLFYNLEIGDYKFTIPTSINGTLGYRYPFIMTNGLTRYRKGNVQCMIISDATVEKGGSIDRKQEKTYRNKVEKFLTDKKPKVYKDSSGEYMVISIIGEPQITPINNLSQKIYNLSFDFVEIGDKDLLTLHHTGVIK